MTMKMLFLAFMAFTGYRLAVGIGRENAAAPLLPRNRRAPTPKPRGRGDLRLGG
jgi:hypothetical protein